MTMYWLIFIIFRNIYCANTIHNIISSLFFKIINSSHLKNKFILRIGKISIFGIIHKKVYWTKMNSNVWQPCLISWSRPCGPSRPSLKAWQLSLPVMRPCTTKKKIKAQYDELKYEKKILYRKVSLLFSFWPCIILSIFSSLC